MATFLSILLLILKIIGILLLILLALLCIILLVPIRYNFEISAPEGGDLSLQGHVGWLLYLISGRIGYLEKKLTYDIKILGFRIRSNDRDFLEQKRKKKEKQKEDPDKQEASSYEEKPPEKENIKENIIEEELPIQEGSPKEEFSAEEGSSKEETDYHPQRYDEKEKREDGGDKEKKDKPGLLEKVSLIPEKISGLGEKVSKARDKAADFMDTLEEYQIMELVALARDTLLSILHHIFPYYLKGAVRYGFDDPSLTGYAAALAALFYPRYYKDFRLEPDFSRVCFSGYCKGRGRIRPGFFLMILIKLLFRKEVRRLLHKLLR